ncbi:MAG: cytochrome b N-terminal domain-containing protein [Alphaproteobacteria bacterium]|nr:cytochrome b N-terminal domain-containing protein [Alphaproteobacteria bacterium]
MAHAPQEEKPGVIGWIEYRLPIFSMLSNALVVYPTPRNLNYFWNFGSIAGIMLVAQILTGIFLAMHYAASTALAFDSVEHIMRNVNYGWLMRYMHAVGASMFFMVTFIHLFRGLYYGSYKRPRELLWFIGVIILLIMMATAFMGYVLPWGQMSFWGATVITNLFSAFPLIGDSIVSWLWGGFSVDNPTLNRFFALHFLLPFVLVGVVMVHLMALHQHGSSNPTGIDVKGPQDQIPFHPYYTSKDFFGFGVFFLVFAAFLFFAPNYLGHPDNYIPADPLVTPKHIVPEWYFLPFYAILRAITFDIPLWIPGMGLLGLTFALRQGDLMRALVGGSKIGSVLVSFLPKKRLGGASTLTLLVLGGLLTIMGFGGGFIASKLGGVLAMFGSIGILFALPWLDTSPVRSANYRPLYQWFFWLFAVNAVVLGYCGSQPPEGIFPLLSLVCTVYYFAHFLIVMPILGRIEKTRPLPQSIAVCVTQKPAR